MAQDVGLEWPPPPPISLRDLLKMAGTALVLSGGGAKGSFEVGVIQYLYGHGFHPSIICSTSVGSVNGLKLAEGEGDGTDPNRGFQGLEQIWLNRLKFNTDMYIEDSWFAAQPDWIKQAVGNSGGDINWFQWSMLGSIPGLAAEKIKDLLDFLGTFKIAHGIWNLKPIEDLARSGQILDCSKLGIPGSPKLRMATVNLRTGALKYVTEKGQLVDDPATPDPNSPQVDPISGMLASAAIPLFFEMQNLAGDWYVDGGIRQIAPVEAAVAMNATQVYAVVASAPLCIDTDYTSKGLVDIGFRAATGVTIDQITTENLSRWGVPVFVMRPNIEVHDTTTIDPGLIRINMAYGFMRAYDILSQQSDPNLQQGLISLSDQIASTRRQIWDAEQDLHKNAWYVINATTDDPGSSLSIGYLYGDVESLRSLKNSLLGLVQCRSSIAGPDSMPSDANNWATVWESHQWAPSDVSLPDSPWSAITYDEGGSDGSSVVVVDISAANPEPTPPTGGCPPPPLPPFACPPHAGF
jgi:predicted acylesterase/phospholipase RssA